jgi:hypothetical protein
MSENMRAESDQYVTKLHLTQYVLTGIPFKRRLLS